MIFEHLIDLQGAALVFGGTPLVTLARIGWRDSVITAGQIGRLFTQPFDAAARRAEIASRVEQMRHDGVIRVDFASQSDPGLAEVTAELSRHRSVEAMLSEHKRQKRQRCDLRKRSVSALERAGDLAPVLGLAGTLIALSQLSPMAFEGKGGAMEPISLAVVSTFYGLLLAHLIFFPLASAIARRGWWEEKGRQSLVDWLAQQLGSACPRAAQHDRVAA